MIEIMVVVRDSETQTREHHLCDVVINAADLHENLAEDVWDEIQRETRTAVTAATRRLADRAHLTREWKEWQQA